LFSGKSVRYEGIVFKKMKALYKFALFRRLGSSLNASKKQLNSSNRFLKYKLKASRTEVYLMMIHLPLLFMIIEKNSVMLSIETSFILERSSENSETTGLSLGPKNSSEKKLKGIQK
jgi:hypothetical protein